MENNLAVKILASSGVEYGERLLTEKPMQIGLYEPDVAFCHDGGYIIHIIFPGAGIAGSVGICCKIRHLAVAHDGEEAVFVRPVYFVNIRICAAVACRATAVKIAANTETDAVFVDMIFV